VRKEQESTTMSLPQPLIADTKPQSKQQQQQQQRQFEWILPSDYPDSVPIQRIQSAIPPLDVLSSHMMESIVCQVRLKAVVTTVMMLGTDSDVLPSVDNDGCSTVSHSNRYDDNSKRTVWTLETLNVYGYPTTNYCYSDLPHLENVVATTAAAATTNECSLQQQQQQQHELYIMFHTHEHSVSGNRPLAIGILSSTQIHFQYHIHWIASPMNYHHHCNNTETKRGHISIHFQYSTGMGCIFPPYKQHWRHGGAIQTSYICRNVTNVLTDDEHNHHQHNYDIMNIQPFFPPVVHRRLSSYDLVVAFGDSVLEQLIASKRCSSELTPHDPKSNSPMIETGPNATIKTRNSCCCCGRIHFGPKVARPLNLQTVPMFLSDLNEFLHPYVQSTSAFKVKSVALILNSALWDVLSDEATMADSGTDNEPLGQKVIDPWKEHVNSMCQYLTNVRQEYPSISIFWLLPTAVHIHRVHLLSEPSLSQKAPQKIRRTKYMSSSRTKHLYEQQKLVLQWFGPQQLTASVLVSELDLYEATYLSADWTLPGDGRHYRREFNERMLSWFY
jgi:hypothetical protein